MSIAFNVLPDTVRVPFAYAEFDGSGASDDPALMPYTVLMVGQMLDSGTAEAGTVQRPMSAAQAATLFGEGSQLAAMCAAYLNANSITKMLAIGVKDAEEGTAAKGALTINGTCVNAVPLCLYINGKLVRAAAPLAAEASAVAENLTNAINADKSLPVTATFSGGEVSLTARHKGECGNDIDLRISYYDEDKPGGLRQGENILSAEGQFDMADRFSDYIVKGQKPGTDKGWGKDACAVRGQYRDQAVQRYRPMLIRAEQSGDSSNAHQRAAWECSVRAARAVTVTATVQGFRQQGVGREQSGPLWQLNQMVDVDLPYLRISQRLLVAGVECRRDATSGSTTRLTLRDPAAFKPEPKKEEKGGSGSGGGDAKMEKEVDLQTRLAQDAAARQKAIK